MAGEKLWTGRTLTQVDGEVLTKAQVTSGVASRPPADQAMDPKVHRGQCEAGESRISPILLVSLFSSPLGVECG